MKPGNITYKMDSEEINVSFDDDNPILEEVPVLMLFWDLIKEDSDYQEPFQMGYRIAVYRNGECLYDSGRVEGDARFTMIFSPPERLKEDDSLFLTVTLWDGYDMITDTESIEL